MMVSSLPTPPKSGGRRANALAVGCMLDEYRIESILGAGGFGVTYKALDTHLDTWVAIKEYFPVEWSFRDPDGATVHPNFQGDANSAGNSLSDYCWGLERFLDEARVLARIQHPYVVRVRRYFRAHGTAYIVMDYEEGQPLSMLLQQEEVFSEEQVRGLLDDVLPALQAVHEQGYLHRDIKPANLYVRANDCRVILIDFGAARQALSRHSLNVTSLVTPGYSPPEQYTTRNDRYGTWTDIYALGAVLYRCVVGCAPTEAADRLLDDTLEPAISAGAGRYSTNLLQAIDRMLEVRPEQRFQTVADMQEALGDWRKNDSDKTVIMLPTTSVKSTQASTPQAASLVAISAKPAEEVSEASQEANSLAKKPTQTPEASQVANSLAEPAIDSAEPNHSDWLNITQLPIAAHPLPTGQAQTRRQKFLSRWRLPAVVASGVILTAVAAMLIWLGISEPTPESKLPSPYSLNQKESSSTDLPTTTEAPAFKALPAILPPTSDVTTETTVPTENTEATSPLDQTKELSAGNESEPVAAETNLEAIDSENRSITENGSELAGMKRTPEIMGPPEPLLTEDSSEPIVAEKPSEATSIEERTTDATGASLVPGMIPAENAPETDMPDEPANNRAAANPKAKTQKKAQSLKAAKKRTRQWKVIPYDPSAREPSWVNPATPRSKRDNLRNVPSNSGFNQK